MHVQHISLQVVASPPPIPLQVYCGWGSSDCVMRAGQKVFLPLEASQARSGGNASIQ